MRVGMSAVRMTMPVIGVADVEMRRCVMFPLFLGRSRPVGMRDRGQLAGEKPDNHEERNAASKHGNRVILPL
jgi:hypothetical protein